MSQTSAETPAAALPAYYQAPVAVHPERHAQAGLKAERSFGYARHSNAVLLTLSEVALAARHYPIAFSAQAPALPLAVVGLRDGENLFVGADGRWREDVYVPAYVRRYPFIFLNDTQSRQLILCVDEQAEMIETPSPNPWFVEGKPSPALREALRFCESYQEAYEQTRSFGEWLDAEQLLENRVARAELDDGSVFSLSGFRTLDAARFRALSDDKVLQAHKRGWLPLLHFHQQSLANWGSLSRLAGAKADSAPAHAAQAGDAGGMPR